MEPDDMEGRKKISLYLHPEELSDRMALDQVDTVPRKKRGELYRHALIAGLALHQLDQRLPELLTLLFTRTLTPDEVINQLAAMTGWKPSQVQIKDVLAALNMEIPREPSGPEPDEKVNVELVRTKLQGLL
ncbi:plasmid partitioning/stability family protein [Serratia sp. 14-2641]|uniref:plasmid partitioning/stability family protein n=1 Tax=Serratia sp. 14-2641 TaxID=1841657 RepID=UPI00080FFA2D|nr:plasmid partitioning/stability family protein [Serratia sp. 14-2641]OCJ37370.1 plasmid stability protein [Serratia sp. 14-2641]